MTLSTHVLDLAAGRPAADLEVVLCRCEGDGASEIARARTDAGGRIASPFGGKLTCGEYQLTFHVRDYFERSGIKSFLTDVPVRFSIASEEHYHVPLLLSPFGYSIYRGS